MKNKKALIPIFIFIIAISISIHCSAYAQSGGLGLEQSIWEKVHFKTNFPEGTGQGFDGKYDVHYTYLDKTFFKKIVESFKVDVSSIVSSSDMEIVVNQLTPIDKKIVKKYTTSSGSKVYTYYSEQLKEKVKDCPFQKKEDAGYLTVYLSFGTSKKLKTFNIFLGRNPK